MYSFLFLSSQFLLILTVTAQDHSDYNQQLTPNPWLSQLTSAVNQWNFDQAPPEPTVMTFDPVESTPIPLPIQRRSRYSDAESASNYLNQIIRQSSIPRQDRRDPITKKPAILAQRHRPPPSHYGDDLFVPTHFYPTLLNSNGQYHPQSDLQTQSSFNFNSNPNLNTNFPANPNTILPNSFNNQHQDQDDGQRRLGARGKSVDYYNDFYDFFQNDFSIPTPPPPIYYAQLNKDNDNNFEYQKNTLMAMPVKDNPEADKENVVPVEQTSGWGMKPYRKPLIKINLGPIMNEFNSVCSTFFPQMEYGSFCARKPRMGYPVDGAKK